MNKNLSFEGSAWNEYLYWQTRDRKTLKRINELLKDITRSPFSGIGKPEPLKDGKQSYRSRRIDEANRIVYKITDKQIVVVQCKGHYEDR